MQRIDKYSLEIINKLYSYLNESSDYAEAEPSEILDERYKYIDAILGEDVLKDVLHMAVACHEYPEFRQKLQEDFGTGVTLELALMINGLENRWQYPQLKGGFETLKKFLRVEKKAENFKYTELFADERLVLYLNGDDYVAEGISDYADLFFSYEDTNTYYGMDMQVQKLEKILSGIETTRGYILQLAGNEGRGRRSILKMLAASRDNGWIFVDMDKLNEQKKEQLRHNIWLIHREALLNDVGICFHHFKAEKSGRSSEYLLQRICGDYEKYCYPITIITDKNTQIIPYVDIPVYRMEIDDCDRNERIEIWRGLSEEYAMDLDYQKYGVQYSLNPGEIKKIFRNLKVEYSKSWDTHAKDNCIARLCMETKAMPAKGSVHKVSSDYSLDDLKLEPGQKKIIEYICAYITESHKVYDEWGMDSKFAYGKGVTALFYGPPGTGKTMAAYVLSNELKIPLYRVDLSQVVDKYIGETEKRLDEIFAYAEKSNVILFFDEADSIFSKRSEVKDSKDKYANTEVSFILQRIEEYSGIVILATNYRNNIDDAFMRRMKYVIEFKMPDVETRLAIWKNSFSDEIPLENIDFEYLAQKIQLSGGYIKNIIINAVFQAAAENSVVTMKHMISSTKNEYMKLGKMLTSQDMEKYSFYLNGDSI